MSIQIEPTRWKQNPPNFYSSLQERSVQSSRSFGYIAEGARSLFGEKVLVKALEFERPAGSNADAMLDHQVSEALIRTVWEVRGDVGY